MQTESSSSQSLGSNIDSAEYKWWENKSYNVSGYVLPINPTKYSVDFNTIIYPNTNNEDIYGFPSNIVVSMTSAFKISPKSGCCIPFCCLFHRCRTNKIVTDEFALSMTYDNEFYVLELRNSTAFGGLITLFEKGKIFYVKLLNVYNHIYVMMVNEKEIFILKEAEESSTPNDKHNHDSNIDLVHGAIKFNIINTALVHKLNKYNADNKFAITWL